MTPYNRKHIYIISCCWLLVNVFLYLLLGTKYATDTVRFDKEAAAWLSGTFEPSYHFWYSGYVAILALCKLLFSSIYPCILIQCFVSLIATLLFYQGISSILKNELTACIAALLTVFYLPIQQWNVCLLTESFFISSVLLFIRAYAIESQRTRWISLAIIAAAAATLRPNGGILLIALLVIAVKEILTKENRLYITAASVLIFTLIIVLLNHTTGVFFQFLFDSFTKGEVICGYNRWTVPAATPAIIDPSKGSILKIYELFLSNPLKSIQLGFCRFISLWTDVRMYYSFAHNVFIGLLLLSAYLFATLGFRTYRNTYQGLFIFTIVYTGLNSVLIMITYADWDGRFLAPLLPVVFIWSALGIHKTLKRV